jgi:cellulose synthase operon protein B
MRAWSSFAVALLLSTQAQSEVRLPVPRPARVPRIVSAEPRVISATPAAPASAATLTAQPSGPLAAITLSDIGFVNGVRFANLGGHRELFVPLPQRDDVTVSDLVLVLDDISAYQAQRNLELQANGRTVAAIVLDGKSRGRIVRIPLDKTKPKDGYLKLSFLYSGAATLDRCIDVRDIGDSVSIRPETAVEVNIGPGPLDVTTTAALMPRDIAIVLPGRRVNASEIASAITVGSALISSGRHVAFYHGYDALPELAKTDEDGRWTHGIILVGPLSDTIGVVDSPVARVAGDPGSVGTLAAVRVGGTPALLVSDGTVDRAGRLFASPLFAAGRGVDQASVGDSSAAVLPAERVSFDELHVTPEQAEVFGRAELPAAIDMRGLPPGTRPTRLLLDMMVAPDSTGEKAVVSAFVNERLLGSTVAATDGVTHLDLPLPDGLVGNIANVRVLIQRDSAQGDCRFEPQGYPAQILGSSALVLTSANGAPHDFSDLISHFSQQLEILLPASAADRPDRELGMVAEVAAQLSLASTPLTVNLVAPGSTPAPDAPFIAVSDAPPANVTPQVRFDQGRVAVTDRTGRTLLDLGGFGGGAVAQLVTAGDYPGLWIRPLSQDQSTPVPAELHLDRGNVAFVDDKGVALAMSTERDTVVRISYPDQVSWLTVAERFRSWIIAGLWLFATAALLLTLQRMFRRRPAGKSD